jgi:hypothetical protein
MTSRFRILSILVVMSSRAGAQSGIPMTASDSVALVRGAVRAALDIRPGARPVCITHFEDSLATKAGRAFVAEGHAAASMMRSPDDSAATLGVTLVGLTGRDTARVVLRLSGDDGPKSRAFWVNRFEYSFVRDSSPGSWQFIARKGLYFADYESDSTVAALPSCLNGRR